VYTVPTVGSNPADITAVPDGTAWFTEPNGPGGQLGRAVDTSPLICKFLLADNQFAFPEVDRPTRCGPAPANTASGPGSGS
jgi:hypothetical protein